MRQYRTEGFYETGSARALRVNVSEWRAGSRTRPLIVKGQPRGGAAPASHVERTSVQPSFSCWRWGEIGQTGGAAV